MAQVKFKRKTYKTGSSIVVTIPEELRLYIGLEEGSDLEMQGENGKKGKYISIWKA